MRLADAMGLPWEEEFDPDGDEFGALFDRLTDATETFLRGGGAISLVDWSGFTPLEREAAALAGDKLRATVSSLTGLASQGEHARVLSVADGGEALIGEHLERMLRELEGNS